MFTKYLIAIKEPSQIYFKFKQVLPETEVFPRMLGLILTTAKS